MPVHFLYMKIQIISQSMYYIEWNCVKLGENLLGNCDKRDKESKDDGPILLLALNIFMFIYSIKLIVNIWCLSWDNMYVSRCWMLVDLCWISKLFQPDEQTFNIIIQFDNITN